MNNIRKASVRDVSRIAEMIVVNYRINFYPFFKNDEFYFGELNVLDTAESFSDEVLENTYVYDDGVVKGVIVVNGDELVKLYVEPQFQSGGVGAALLEFAKNELGITWLWALEYNRRGISFYKRHGLVMTGERIVEDDWVPLVKMSLSGDMRLEKLNAASPDKPVFDRINSISFDDEQFTALDDLFSSDKGNLDILGIYFRDEPVGYFSARRYKGIAYLGYFAIAPEHRCNGLGGRAMTLLKDHYGDMQIVAEIESTEEGSGNAQNRRRRKNFYLNNGMNTTGWYQYYDDVELELICSGREFRKDELEELNRQIHTLYYDSVPELYRKQGEK